MYTWIILSIATVLRLVLINQSLWLDESIEALALMLRQGPLLQYALGDYQPPLYHLLGYAMTQLLGYSEVVLRLPALLSGIGTVYFVIKIGGLLGSKRVGMLAGLLAATNPILIYYSQEGRTYALTTFLVSASFYYFFQLLKNQTKDSKLTLYYLLFTTAFIWTSYLSWFVLLGQGVYALWKKRFDLVLIQGGAALTLLIWLPSLISSLAIGQSTRTNSPLWGDVVGGLTWKSLPLTWVKFAIGRISFDSKILYALIVAGLALVHSYILSRVSIKKATMLLLWLIPPVVLAILTAGVIPIYQYFRVLFVLPAYLLLLAMGLQQLPKKYTILIVLVQLTCLGYFWLSPRYQREDWRSLATTLKQDSSATVAMPSRAQSAPLLYYDIPQSIVEPSHESVEGVRVYYIRYVEDLFDTDSLGRANLIRAGYTITSQRVYTGIQVDVYENRH